MANYYVHSGAAGAGTGADWANAFLTLSAAVSGKAAGDVFYVAHDHAETTAAAVTISSPGTEATPCRIYCVNRAGSVPPVSADLRTTATVSTTGASTINLAGTVIECYGVTFTAGDAANNASIVVASSATRSWRLVNCALRLGNSNAASRLTLGGMNSAQVAVLENTTLQFGATTQRVTTQSNCIWRNTPSALTGAIIPTSLFLVGADLSRVFLDGIDLSAAAGKTIFPLGASICCFFTANNCRLGTGAVIGTNPSSPLFASEVLAIRCDSGDTNYRTEKYAYGGTLTTETTIVRSGGASDGTTPIAWKIVTTANSRWEYPFECLPITIWQETVGSAITVTVQGIWGSGAVPNSDDIWIDVEYLGTSGFPLGSKATSNKADGLATGTAIPAGSGTWGGSTTKFAMSATFTPQEKGPVTIYVRAAKASSTFYVDPQPVVT